MKHTRNALCLIPLLVLAGTASPVRADDTPHSMPALVASMEGGPIRIDLPPANAQRWYTSILTQQQMITERIEDIRNNLHRDRLGTQDFLDEVSALFERTNRLYEQWKRLENSSTTRPLEERTFELQEGVASPPREDVAVGKSLNYLRLSLINFFLGYCDSNGKQIDDAEKQARLSKLWRTRSQLFVNALDS